jgi:putative peptidoglycan lipid II flippase
VSTRHDPRPGPAGLVRQSGLTSVTAAASIASGLLLDAVIAARFGAGTTSDAFFVAARIPIGLTVFVLSGATQVLVPAFSLWLVRKQPQEWSRLVSLVLTSVLLIGGAVALVGGVAAGPIMRMTAPGLSAEGADLAASLARVLFLIVPLGAAAEILRALLNARRASVVPAAMSIAMNGTAAVLVAALGDGRIDRVAQAYVAGATVQLVFILFLAHRHGFRYRPGWPFGADEVREVGRLSIRPLASSGIQLVTRLGEQLLVSFLPAGSISILNYGNRLIAAIGGSVFFRSVIVGLLPRLTQAAATDDRRAFEETTRTGVRIMLAISLPLTAFMVVLAEPAAFVIFRRGNLSPADARLLGLVLAVYSASLIGAALQRVLLGTFLAHLETRVQLRNTIYGALVDLALVYPLALLLGRHDPHAVLAVPIAYSCAQVVNVAHAWVRMRSQLGVSLFGLGRFGLRLAVASLVATGSMVAASSSLALSNPVPRFELALRAVAVAVVGAATLGGALVLLLGRDIQRSWAAKEVPHRTGSETGAAIGPRDGSQREAGGPAVHPAKSGEASRSAQTRLRKTESTRRVAPVASKLGKAIGTARRLGFSGCFHLLYVGVLEPLLMKPFLVYVHLRRLAMDRMQRLTAETRLAHWRMRREEVLASATVASARTDSLIGPNQLDRLRKAAGSPREIALADIDQDGFLCSRVAALRDVPIVSRDRFAPRARFDLIVVDLDGVPGVKKHFKGDVPGFIAELAASHDLHEAGCRVPAILDVDFEELTITLEFLPGPVLREELARHGAVVRDRDVATHPSYSRLSPRKQRAMRLEEGKAVLDRVIDTQTVEGLFAELKKIHAAGYVLHDIKFGNVILGESPGEPYFIDFDRARAYHQLSPLAFRVLRDRDYVKFNEHFGTEKLHYRRARELSKRRAPRVGRSYAPIYIEGGLRFGKIWSTDVGYGRWRYILGENLPPLTDARVLDLGANNGFNGIQMMRLGAREVVAVEIDDGAIAEGGLVKELFEWADNRSYDLKYVCESMTRLPQLDLGTFDLVTALCSIYYLDDDEIALVVSHVSTIADTLVLQCNTDRGIDRSAPRTYEKASVGYALGALQRNGFPLTRVVAPRGYSRPLVIGRRKA